MILFANDISVGYDEASTGLPLVFLHEFPHNRSLWAAQMDGLAAPCRTIALDLRGFGESSVAAPFSMDQWADDVAATMAVLGHERAAFAGLSMGGYVAFALWRRHPALARALILADTRAGADDAATRARRRRLMDLVESVHRMMTLAPPRRSSARSTR